MEKLEYRAVIKFLLKDGLKPKQIFLKLQSVYGDGVPSYATVKNWAAEFKEGRTSIIDEPRGGRPKTATASKNVNIVNDMIKEDPRIRLRELIDAIGISKERVRHIIHGQLHMKKLYACWVPQTLTDNQRQERIKLSEECLALYNKDKMNFLQRFVTVGETWFHLSPVKVELESECPKPKKPKFIPIGKVLVSIFWDSKGILFINYHQTDSLLTSEYYFQLLNELEKTIFEKRPELCDKGIIFYQDDSAAHCSVSEMYKRGNLKYEVQEYPEYCADLAPSDYHLFPRLEGSVSGEKFGSVLQVQQSVEEYFGKLKEQHFRDGILALIHRWRQCVVQNGEYVENESVLGQ